MIWHKCALNSLIADDSLTPVIGYQTAAAIANHESETGKSVQEIVTQSGLIKSEKVAEIFSIENPKFIQQ